MVKHQILDFPKWQFHERGACSRRDSADLQHRSGPKGGGSMDRNSTSRASSPLGARTAVDQVPGGCAQSDGPAGEHKSGPKGANNGIAHGSSVFSIGVGSADVHVYSQEYRDRDGEVETK